MERTLLVTAPAAKDLSTFDIRDVTCASEVCYMTQLLVLYILKCKAVYPTRAER